MYDKKDPRSALAPKGAAGPTPTGLIAEQQIGLFYDAEPAIDDENGKVWFNRGCNFVLSWADTNKGGTFSRTGQPDEYVVLVPKGGATITWNGETTEVPDHSIAFVPPGDSTVVMREGGPLCRLFTTKSKDLISLCLNADSYTRPRTHIPPFEAWPEPPAGWKVRHYKIDVPIVEGRFGRIYRCTTFMVNYLPHYDGPRDPHRVSPHHHDDFEQCSLAVEGEFTHYLRWPWTIDIDDWREDRADHVLAPSSYVIPPPVVHTTRAVGSERNQLVDIFCPPRVDFSQKEGWVLNADDYPVPDLD